MYLTVKILFVCLLLVACGTSEPSRYRDISRLEQPPILATSGVFEEQQVLDDRVGNGKERISGLGDKVYWMDSTPPALGIKQSFDKTWNTLNRALTQLDLKVTDHNREEKAYYVKFDADDYEPEDGNFLDSALSLFSNDYVEQTYKLKVETMDSGTGITAETVDKTEPGNEQETKDKESSGAPADGSGRLLKKLYKTLHDELKAE